LKVLPLEIGERGSEQLALLGTQQSDAQRQRSKKLMSVMDELNQKMGRGTVRIGSPSAGTSTAWHLRYEHRSTRYTTRWEELPRVRTD
jgi:DNA polymerase V